MGTTVEGDVRVTWLDHASVLLDGSTMVMIDAFEDAIEGEQPVPDLYIVTHSHFDHYDPEYINDHVGEDTVVLAHRACDIGQLECEVRMMEPGDEETVGDVTVTAVEAYNDHRFRNPGEPFHPQGQGMGVLVELDGMRFYHLGDTDDIPELASLADTAIDLAFVPIGGTYTMDVEEAIEAVTAFTPDEVVPIHYNMIDGTGADVHRFKRIVESQGDTLVTILDPE